MKKADAIITADIELRLHAPICRTDDYWSALVRKIEWLRELQEEHNGCPILDGGDLFDKKYKVHPSHDLIGWAIRNLPEPFYTVPGNHDLPGKSIENFENSAMSVLEDAEVVTSVHDHFESIKDYNIYGFAWDEELEEPSLFNSHKNIALIHAMVYKKDLPFPGCEGYSAQEVMDLLPSFDLIVCGHHHQTFTHQDGDRILVNPGSLMRNDADQIKHKPCVFLWYAKENTVKKIYVPIEQGVISREHIEEKNDRDTRMDAFIEKLGGQAVEGINFSRNLENLLTKKKIRKPVKDKVWQYVEGV